MTANELVADLRGRAAISGPTGTGAAWTRAADEIENLQSQVFRLQWKADYLDNNFPCDGGCNADDGPAEECSRDGRSPLELWSIIGRLSEVKS